MNISILGSGNMAHGIGTRAVIGNHSVTIYDRELEKAKELAAKLGPKAVGEELGESITGEVVIFALPYPAIPEVIEKYKDQLANKILVDISNPLNFETFELLPPAGSSGAEEIAKHLPMGVRLVKAFNTTLAGTLVAGEIAGQKLDVFIAGDDQESKKKVKELADSSGMRGIDAGPLKHARHLEGIQLIHMASQQQLGTNWMSIIKFLS